MEFATRGAGAGAFSRLVDEATWSSAPDAADLSKAPNDAHTTEVDALRARIFELEQREGERAMGAFHELMQTAGGTTGQTTSGMSAFGHISTGIGLAVGSLVSALSSVFSGVGSLCGPARGAEAGSSSFGGYSAAEAAVVDGSSASFATKRKVDIVVPQLVKKDKRVREVFRGAVPDVVNEEDWEKWHDKAGVLFPVGPLKFRWDLLMLVLILYSAVTVPFRLCMDYPAEGAWWYLEVVISLCFLTDFGLNWVTAYADGDQFVINHRRIRANYLGSWCIIDLSSSIPLELIDLAIRTHSGGDLTEHHENALRYLRWHKFSPELAKRIRAYYEFYFSRKSAMNEDEIINNLAPTLKRAALIHLLGKTVQRIPLFHGEKTRMTLDLQIEVMGMLKPILREAKEPISESLEKGAPPGPSVYFVRRGTIVVEGDVPDPFGGRLSLFEIDASSEPGMLIGEHSLTYRSQSMSRYHAKTRSELFTLAVTDLHAIFAALEPEKRDLLARTVLTEHARRRHMRALALRMVFNASAASGAASQITAPLRIQCRWMKRDASRWMTRAVMCTPDALADLVPGLYTGRTESGADFDVLGTPRKERTQRLRRITNQPAGSMPPSDLPSDRAGRTGAGDLSRALAEVQLQLVKLEARVSRMTPPDDWVQIVRKAVAEEMGQTTKRNNR